MAPAPLLDDLPVEGVSAPDASAVDAKALVDAGKDADLDANRDAETDARLNAEDAALDSEPDATEALAPRPIAPLSTSRVTSRRPTLHWAFPSGLTDATVDLCRDRGCTEPIGPPTHVTGTSYAPTSDLPSGVVYWRLHPATLRTITSATWEFTVGVRSAPVDTSWGTTLDVNGDGYPDLAVSGPSNAYVYLGGADGLAGAPAITLTDPDPDGGIFSVSVASAGDVNGDGYADLVVGADDDSNGGQAYLYLGGGDGLAPTPVILTDPGGAGGTFGASVASAGDVNGDGYADLVVSAFRAANLEGGVYVYLGGAGGLASAPATILFNPGGENHTTFGSSVASADVNGDGYADVVVGAYAPTFGFSGRTYVYLGGTSGLATQPATTLNALNANDEFGASVANAGDVNGDGYADILVGADLGSGAYVYLGSATGIGTAPSTTLTGQDTRFGAPVACAGDVNGDGYADIVVGDPYRENSTGVAYVYLGSETGLATSPSTTLPSLGGEQGYFGASVGSAGDVNGDGYSDLFISASSFPFSAARAYVYLGSAAGVAISPSTTLESLDGGAGIYFATSVFGASN